VRLQDEGFAIGDGDGAHQLLDSGAVLKVDKSVAAVLEDAELVAQAKIDRTASELLGRKGGGDLDLSLFKIAMDIDVRQNHS